jgi:hypothetical protein
MVFLRHDIARNSHRGHSCEQLLELSKLTGQWFSGREPALPVGKYGNSVFQDPARRRGFQVHTLPDSGVRRIAGVFTALQPDEHDR